MEKEKFFMNEGNTFPPTWNSTQFGMEIQNSELNSTSEQIPIPNCFFNPNWENSMDQSDPFESALSSIVSSPTTSHPGISGNNGENIVLRELIGRLGSICNSGEISPHSFIGGNGNHSSNTSCYTTPLNSPPKLNLSMMDHQIRGMGNQLPFSTDPGFAERAAKFSCFGGKSLGGINGQTGENESEFPHKLSRVSSSQSFKVAGSQVGFQENKEGFLQEGIQASDKKFSRLSRSSTPEKAKLGDSMEESSVSEQIPGGEIGIKGKTDANANAKKRKSIPRGKAKEIPSAPCSKDAKAAAENEESDTKRSKSNEGNSNGKDEAKENGNQKQTKDNSKPIEPPKDYIHVRARRGQATDSHSLAERVRREKISERMKFLQDLVPGCNKVIGKAVMLDEIINYVQSLQRQVEFLSMKLSTVNPRMDFNVEALLSKDIFQSRGTLPHNIYPVDTSAQAFPYTYQSQQGSNIHNNIPNGTETPFSMNSLNAAIRRNTGLQLPSVDGFNEAAASQVSAFWEDDLQSVVQMGFGQNQLESFHGSNATTNMKAEL